MTVDVDVNPGDLSTDSISSDFDDELKQEIKQKVTTKPISNADLIILLDKHDALKNWLTREDDSADEQSALDGLDAAAGFGFEIMLADMLEAIPDAKRLAAITRRKAKGNNVIGLALSSDNPAAVWNILASLTDDDLLKLLKRVNKKGNGLLHLAAEKFIVNVIARILDYIPAHERLAILTRRNNKGKTVLHLTASNNDAKGIETLVESLPEDLRTTLLTIKDKQGQTPLNTAVINNYAEVVDSLMKCLSATDGYKLVTTPNSNNEAIIHTAAKCSNGTTFINLIKYLSDEQRMAAITAQDKQGNIALVYLLQRNMLTTAKVILQTLPQNLGAITFKALKQALGNDKKLRARINRQAKQWNTEALYLAVGIEAKPKRLALMRPYLPANIGEEELALFIELLPAGKVLLMVQSQTQIDLRTLWQNKATRLKALTETFKAASYEDCLKWLEELTRQPNNLFNEHRYTRLDTVFQKTYTYSYSKTLQELRKITLAKLQEELAKDKQNQKRLLINALKSTAFTKPRGNYFFTGAYSSTRSEQLIRQEAIKVSEISAGAKEVVVKTEPNLGFYRFQLW